MARTTLYSRSPRAAPAPAGGGHGAAPAPVAAPADAATADAAPPAVSRRQRWRAVLLRHERWAWAAGALLLALAAGWPAWRLKLPAQFSLEQIDAALRESIAKEPLPSAAAAAYEAVLPSVVRVVGLPAVRPGDAGAGAKGSAGTAGNPSPGDDDDDSRSGRSVGTGVVIVNSGLILTNLHVVLEADRIQVTFADGSESDAVVVSRQPENDLAVLQAKTLPDDLQAATMRSTGGLSPGDAVVAVGFPYGIGPSASAGVVSGLKREFRSPQGRRVLTNLIQFDAAANPGNSGGPLVTLDGHVVGIVTAIMNPEGHSTFIGIGFAVPIENAAAAAGMPPF
jgi:S1-C subfamily serine protease